MGSAAGYSVLVIGDRVDSLDVIVKGVAVGGIKMTIASNAGEAVAGIESKSVELLLLYRPTDQLKQYGILARLRELKRGKELPVIVIVDPRTEVLARGAGDMLGIDDFVHAPPDIANLIQLMNKAVDGADAKRIAKEAGSGKLNMSKVRRIHLEVAQKNHFERLGITHSTGTVGVRKAFRAAVTLYSMDNLEENTREGRRMIRDIQHCLGESHKVLSDTALRKRYERTIHDPSIVYTEPTEQLEEYVPIQEPVTTDYDVEQAALAQSEAQQETAPAMTAEAASPKVSEPDIEGTSVGGMSDGYASAFDRVTNDLGAEAEAAIEPAESEADADAPDTNEVSDLEEETDSIDVEPEESEDPKSGVDFDSMTSVFRERDSESERRDKESGSSKKSGSGDVWSKGKQVKESHDQLAAAAHLQAVIGDYGGAVELLKQCVRMKPDITEYRYNLELNLGRNYKKMGNKTRAEQHFQEALQYAPTGNTAAADELTLLGGDPADGAAPQTGIGDAFGRLFRGKKS